MSFYGASAAGDGGGAFLGGGGFPHLETDLEAVVRPVVHPVARLMAMVLVVAVAARPMEVSIPRRFDPVGGPPVLTPSSASDVREYLASSHAAMIAVAIRCASVLSASSGKPATHPAQVTQGPEPRKGMGLRAMRRRRSASLSALNLSRSLLSSEDGSSR